jgi:hypothetical protein
VSWRARAVAVSLGVALAREASGEAPESLVQSEARWLETLADMAASNPYVLSELGAEDARALGSARLDWSKALRVEAVAFDRLAGASRLEAALEPTELYYVPYCVSSRCGALATFRLPNDGSAPEVAALGMAPMVRALEELRSRWDAVAPPGVAMRPVFLLGPGIPLAYGVDDASRAEMILAGTALDEADIRKAVPEAGRPFLQVSDVSRFASALVDAAAASAPDAPPLGTTEAASSPQPGSVERSTSPGAKDLSPVASSATADRSALPPSAESRPSRSYPWAWIVAAGAVIAAILVASRFLCRRGGAGG